MRSVPVHAESGAGELWVKSPCRDRRNVVTSKLQSLGALSAQAPPPPLSLISLFCSADGFSFCQIAPVEQLTLLKKVFQNEMEWLREEGEVIHTIQLHVVRLWLWL